MSPFAQTSARQISALPDCRADGGIRKVSFDQRSVRIERAVAGVKMRVAVPVEYYRGVVLTLEEGRARRFYKVALAHRDAEFSVELGRAADWSEILPIWQNWAHYFGRPAIFDGELEQKLELPPLEIRAFSRRRGTGLFKRRPKFLMRRRPGRTGALVNLLDGARELISYE